MKYYLLNLGLFTGLCAALVGWWMEHRKVIVATQVIKTREALIAIQQSDLKSMADDKRMNSQKDKDWELKYNRWSAELIIATREVEELKKRLKKRIEELGGKND